MLIWPEGNGVGKPGNALNRSHRASCENLALPVIVEHHRAAAARELVVERNSARGRLEPRPMRHRRDCPAATNAGRRPLETASTVKANMAKAALGEASSSSNRRNDGGV